MLEGIPHREQAAFFFAQCWLLLWHDSLRGLRADSSLNKPTDAPPLRSLVCGLTHCVWIDTGISAHLCFILNSLQEGLFRATVLIAGARR